MTERKKISLRPAAGDAPAPTERRRPPLRGSGTAPRARPTAADAAKAAEERAQRPAEPQREGGGWDERHPRDQRDSRDQRDERPRQARGDGQGYPDRSGRGQEPRGHDNRSPYGDRQDPRGQRDPRDPRNQRDPRDPRAQPDPRDGRPPRDARDDRHPHGGPRSDRPAPRQDDRGPYAGRPQRQDGPDHSDRLERPMAPPRFDDRRRTTPDRNGDAPYAARPPTPPAAPREEDGRVRLSKLMSEQGLSSRREADEWIEQGWVRVDGEVVDELGTRVFPHQHISIDPMASSQQAQRVTILLHKPIGYVSGQAEDGYEPAVTLIRPENRWADDKQPLQLTRGHLRNLAPAGRLDIDSTGLLVLTQDGRVAKHLIGEDSGVEKEYLVRVQWLDAPEAENVAELVPDENIEAMRFGLELDGKPLKHAQVSWQNEQQLRVVLREGRKRQIRRMCELVGLKVVGLKRVRLGRITLSKLPLGEWRFLRPDERF